MSIIGVRNKIDSEKLFSSTTYPTEAFDRCVYCHNYVENDFFEYNGEYIGQPYRCNCDNAIEELKSKEELFKTLIQLEEHVDKDRVNEATKEYLISEVNRAYEEECPEILNYIFKG